VLTARRQSLLRFSKRLTRLPYELESATSDLADIEMEIVIPEDVIKPIRTLAELFKRIADSFLKRYSSRRISGRDHHLVYLATMIEKVTGREHYKELASPRSRAPAAPRRRRCGCYPWPR
jgi:hypothetical protein